MKYINKEKQDHILEAREASGSPEQLALKSLALGRVLPQQQQHQARPAARGGHHQSPNANRNQI